jgi:hypothetical protein
VSSFGDNALVYVQNNGANSVSIDLPNYTPGNLHINHNLRNGQPYFNTWLFTPNALGTQGNAKRRFFYGPGIDNVDIALHKITKLNVSHSNSASEPSTPSTTQNLSERFGRRKHQRPDIRTCAESSATAYRTGRAEADVLRRKWSCGRRSPVLASKVTLAKSYCTLIAPRFRTN